MDRHGGQHLGLAHARHPRGRSHGSRPQLRHTGRLGIDYLGCVAEMPDLKGSIEKIFRTSADRLVSRLVGRTFSNPQQRGDYDSDAMARLKPRQLVKAFIRFAVDIHHNTPLDKLKKRTPRQAWDEHVRDFGVRPHPDLRTMRHVFGTAETRTITEAGLEVRGVTYQSEDLARLYMRGRKRRYDVRWWPHDVGAIEVRLGPDEWLTVDARDEGLAGKSIDEVRPWAATPEHPDLVRIRDQTFEDIDNLDPEVALERRTFQASWTPEWIKASENKRVRHIVTAERTARQGPARGLLDDVVESLPTPPRRGEDGPEIAPTPTFPT